MPEVESTMRLGADIPEDLYEALRSLAARNERSIAAEIRLAVRAWIASDSEQAKAAA